MSARPTTGGVDEPNADWTEAARGLIADALKQSNKVAGASIVFADEPTGDDGAYLAEYRAVHCRLRLDHGPQAVRGQPPCDQEGGL